LRRSHTSPNLTDPVPARFQFEAVRDVVGILRAMYRQERDKRSPSPVRMQKIERLAREFLGAYKMAAAHDPETAPYVRACKQAENSALRLDGIVTVVDPIEPVLRVAGERVIGAASRRTEGEYRWAVGRKPG
jgi:hypothetical protein